jgi:hypothetical protein
MLTVENLKIENLQGPTGWIEPKRDHRAQISRATLVNDNKIVIIVYCDATYSIELHRQAGEHFKGKWAYRDGGKIIEGFAEGRLYKAEHVFFLFGTWNEDETDHYWWAELFVNKLAENE